MAKQVKEVTNVQEAIERGKDLIRGRWSCAGLKDLDLVWKNNFSVMRELIMFRPDALEYASDELRSNRELATLAVEMSSKTFKFVLGDLKDDPEFVKKVVLSSNKGESLAYASQKLRSNKEFIMEVISIKPMCLEHVSRELADDDDIVRLAIEKNPNSIKFASERFKDNKELIVSLMRRKSFYKEDGKRVKSTKNLYIISCASERLKSDPEIVIPTIKEDVYTYRCFSDKIKKMRKLALYVVKKAGSLLADVDDRFKDDKEIVLAAVNNYGYSLEYASDRLKADREVVLAAIRKDARSIVFASKELREDFDIVIEAFKSFGGPFIIDPIAQNVFQRFDREVISTVASHESIKREIRTTIESNMDEQIAEIELDIQTRLEEILKSNYHEDYKSRIVAQLNLEKGRRIRELKQRNKEREYNLIRECTERAVIDKLSKQKSFIKLRKFYNGTISPLEMLELQEWLISQARQEECGKLRDFDIEQNEDSFVFDV